jgi:hypothetical protein
MVETFPALQSTVLAGEVEGWRSAENKSNN